MAIKQDVIRATQKKADTKTQKIDAAIVSRIVSIALDELAKILKKR